MIKIVSCFGIIFFVNGALAMGGQDNEVAAQCERRWMVESSRIFQDDPPNFRGLLESWQKAGNECHGSVSYEARLALIYYYLNEPTRALEVLRPFTGDSGQYGYLIELVKGLVEADKLSLRNSTDVNRLESIEGRLRKLLVQNPSRTEIYGVLGGIQVLLGHHVQAVDTLEKALNVGSAVTPKVGVFRNLTVAYTEIGRYEDAFRAAGNAIGMSKAITNDQFFMYAVAKTNAALGNIADAQLDLKLIVAKKPEVRGTYEFNSALQFVKDRMKVAK